jgi:Uma2 family endonuclease
MGELPATLVSVEEYLRTSYHPDREYVDGVLVERNLGRKRHTPAQRSLIEYFAPRRSSHGHHAFQEQRIQVRENRFRLSDVCVYLGAEPDEEVFTSPPFPVIEILSPDDKHGELVEKIGDYLKFGVQFVWVIDPDSRRGEIDTSGEMHEARDAVMRTSNPSIEISLADILR